LRKSVSQRGGRGLPESVGGPERSGAGWPGARGGGAVVTPPEACRSRCVIEYPQLQSVSWSGSPSSPLRTVSGRRWGLDHSVSHVRSRKRVGRGTRAITNLGGVWLLLSRTSRESAPRFFSTSYFFLVRKYPFENGWREMPAR